MIGWRIISNSPPSACNNGEECTGPVVVVRPRTCARNYYEYMPCEDTCVHQQAACIGTSPHTHIHAPLCQTRHALAWQPPWRHARTPGGMWGHHNGAVTAAQACSMQAVPCMTPRLSAPAPPPPVSVSNGSGHSLPHRSSAEDDGDVADELRVERQGRHALPGARCRCWEQAVRGWGSMLRNGTIKKGGGSDGWDGSGGGGGGFHGRGCVRGGWGWGWGGRWSGRLQQPLNLGGGGGRGSKRAGAGSGATPPTTQRWPLRRLRWQQHVCQDAAGRLRTSAQAPLPSPHTHPAWPDPHCASLTLSAPLTVLDTHNRPPAHTTDMTPLFPLPNKRVPLSPPAHLTRLRRPPPRAACRTGGPALPRSRTWAWTAQTRCRASR